MRWPSWRSSVSLIGLLVYALPAYVGVPVAFALAALFGLAAQTAFNDSAIIWPIATPLLVQAPLALFIGLLGQYLLERRRGQRISDAINYYLPDDIARDLSQDKFDTDKLNKVVYSTCLATDMAGFSTIAEQLPPGELAVYLNDYFETLAAPLKRHGVHVTEFRADAIMCAWTADRAVGGTTAQGPARGTRGRRGDQGLQAAAPEAAEGKSAHRPGGRHGLCRARRRRRALRLQHRRRFGQHRLARRGAEQARRHPDPRDRRRYRGLREPRDPVSRATSSSSARPSGIPIHEVVALRENATPSSSWPCVSRFDEASTITRRASWAAGRRVPSKGARSTSRKTVQPGTSWRAAGASSGIQRVMSIRASFGWMRNSGLPASPPVRFLCNRERGLNREHSVLPGIH